jgi:NitT/TauT family transport system permease protein
MLEENFLMGTSIIKKEIFYTSISFLLLLVLWKIISLIVGSEIIFPSPESTLASLIELIKTRDFFLSILASLARGMVGFIISLVLGTIFGFIAGFNGTFYRIFEPFLVIIRTTPVISVILLALIWFRASNVPVFASFLMSFPIVCTNVIEGIKNIDNKLIEMARVYKIGRPRIIRDIYLPSITPFLMAAISTSFGIGWKVVIAAEVLSLPEFAIGTSLQTAKTYLNINEVFAWTIVAILMGYTFERLIRLLEKRTFKWKRENVTGY